MGKPDDQHGPEPNRLSVLDQPDVPPPERRGPPPARRAHDAGGRWWWFGLPVAAALASVLLGALGLSVAALITVFAVPALVGVALIKGAPLVAALAQLRPGEYPGCTLWLGRIAGTGLLLLGLLLELGIVAMLLVSPD